MGVSTVGSIVAAQIKAAGFDVKKLKISGTSLKYLLKVYKRKFLIS